MSGNRRSIARDVSHLTPSHPKSKVIFGVSGFQTSFFCYQINSGDPFSARNSKNTLLALILLTYSHFPYVWRENPSSPDFLRILWIFTICEYASGLAYPQIAFANERNHYLSLSCCGPANLKNTERPWIPKIQKSGFAPVNFHDLQFLILENHIFGSVGFRIV